MTLRSSFAVVAVLLCAPLSSAETVRGIVTTTFENDVFTGSDDRFSNGLSVTWTSGRVADYKTDSFVQGWAKFWSFLPGADGRKSDQYVSWSLSHEMHTPEDISLTVPDPADQPYAGLINFDSSLYSVNERWAQAWNLRLGMVGPISQADHVQIGFHDLIGAERPEGWDSQIQNELVLNVMYGATYRLYEQRYESGLGLRFSPVANAELGTYSTTIGAGVMAEIGWNMPDNLAVRGVGTSFQAVNAIAAEIEDRWSITGYGALGGHGVAHFLPLDGPVFRDGPSVGSDDFVTTVELGVTARRGRFIGSFGLALGGSPADQFEDNLDFGVFTLSWIY
ncbi:MAG: lipid A deacylase LpxR family protein [Pseudomonadota bacterium]